MINPTCAYCGKNELPCVKKPRAIMRLIKRLKSEIKTPICGRCWELLKTGAISASTRTSDLYVHTEIKKLLHECTQVSNRTGLETLIRITDRIGELEAFQKLSEDEFLAKAKEAQNAADRVSKIQHAVASAIQVVESRISVSYAHCRKLANIAISDYELRVSIFKRDGFVCRKCGSSERLSIDHVKPVVEGGGNEPENLQTLCLPCNLKKGSA